MFIVSVIFITILARERKVFEYYYVSWYNHLINTNDLCAFWILSELHMHITKLQRILKYNILNWYWVLTKLLILNMEVDYVLNLFCNLWPASGGST